jgi:hypothetical protein
LPLDFVKELLSFTNLSRIGDCYETISLFELPRVCRVYVSNLLLSAVKIDRDQKIETGFYENLFLSIRNILDDIQRNLQNNTSILDETQGSATYSS